MTNTEVLRDWGVFLRGISFFDSLKTLRIFITISYNLKDCVFPIFFILFQRHQGLQPVRLPHPQDLAVPGRRTTLRPEDGILQLSGSSAGVPRRYSELSIRHVHSGNDLRWFRAGSDVHGGVLSWESHIIITITHHCHYSESISWMYCSWEKQSKLYFSPCAKAVVQVFQTIFEIYSVVSLHRQLCEHLASTWFRESLKRIQDTVVKKYEVV